jgi:hypothetical protein
MNTTDRKLMGYALLSATLAGLVHSVFNTQVITAWNGVLMALAATVAILFIAQDAVKFLARPHFMHGKLSEQAWHRLLALSFGVTVLSSILYLQITSIGFAVVLALLTGLFLIIFISSLYANPSS